jgi:hypothetical protein
LIVLAGFLRQNPENSFWNPRGGPFAAPRGKDDHRRAALTDLRTRNSAANFDRLSNRSLSGRK